MTKLVIASNNDHKIAEIRSILKNKFYPIVSLAEENIVCEPEENGETFLKNAIIKATEVKKYTDCAVLADDTGLCVEYLDGAPGVHSARYAGNHDNEKNRKKLLNALKNVKKRNAYFETAIALLLPDGKLITASGKVYGSILEKEDGENGFGYDSLFYCDELEKSFGQASEIEKNSVSHRARALKNLLDKLN